MGHSGIFLGRSPHTTLTFLKRLFYDGLGYIVVLTGMLLYDSPALPKSHPLPSCQRYELSHVPEQYWKRDTGRPSSSESRYSLLAIDDFVLRPPALRLDT